jgi:hypothetical protein
MATRLLAIAVLEKRIATEKAALKAGAGAALIVGERVSGFLDPADRQGTALGHVQLTKARESWQVIDGDDLHAWVAEHAPTEIETVPATQRVRPAFRDALLAACKADGGWVSPDGELLEVDGVECRTGQPILTVKPNDTADALVAAALAEGRLQIGAGQ